jgi:hypothetical protein
LVRQEGTSRDEVDLWPRLRIRLQAGAEEERLRLHFPTFDWPIAAALAAVAAVPCFVAEPVEFVALIVGLL